MPTVKLTKRLIDEFAQTQEMLSETVGKSRSHVANTLRLLGLPEEIKLMLQDGRLSAGHGRALLGAPKPLQLAEDIIALGLNVRQSENIAKGHRARGRPTRRREKDTNTLALEHDLSSALGLSVSIQDRSPRGGGVTISYETLEQLDELCRRLTRLKPDEDSTAIVWGLEEIGDKTALEQMREIAMTPHLAPRVHPDAAIVPHASSAATRLLK